MRDRERYEAPPHRCSRPRPHLAAELVENNDAHAAEEVARHLTERVRGAVQLGPRKAVPLRSWS